MSSNPLRVLNSLGQSVWFDYIRRRDLMSGHIKELIDNDGVSGITSNPSIFEKAIAGSNDYDESIRKLVEAGVETPLIFEVSGSGRHSNRRRSVSADVRFHARGAMVMSASKSRPHLARDTKATIADARRSVEQG